MTKITVYQFGSPVAEFRRVISAKLKDSLNGDCTLDFSVTCGMAERLANGMRVELTGDGLDYWFNIVRISKSISDGMTVCAVSCEHITYILNDDEYKITEFEFSGLASACLAQLLRGTPFTVGTCYCDIYVELKINKECTLRAAIMQLLALCRAEIGYTGMSIDIHVHRGDANYREIMDGKQVTGISMDIDSRSDTKNYSLKLCKDISYYTGDNVHIVFRPFNLDTRTRIIEIDYNPFFKREISVTVGSYIPTILDTLYEKDEDEDEEEGGDEPEDEKPDKAKPDIVFMTGRLYYGGEEYRLQRGDDRRIIAVTQGTKCTQIYSDTEGGSEAEAVTAVERGLDQPWDIEFMTYFNSAVTITIVGGEGSNAPVELATYNELLIDYGDGSKFGSNVKHSYRSKGFYKIRIKTDAAEIVGFAPEWHNSLITDKALKEVGVSAYIGGKIETVKEVVGSYIRRLVWGESVKYLYFLSALGSAFTTGKMAVGLPPYFIGQDEGTAGSINGGNQIFTLSRVNYLYIPASCTLFPHNGAGSSLLKRLEIESSGGTLKIGRGAFSDGCETNSYHDYPVTPLKIIDIPGRVDLSYLGNQSIAMYAGARIVRVGSGITSIPQLAFFRSNTQYIPGEEEDTHNYLQYVFIPKTVRSIGVYAFSSPIKVIYEGTESEWNAVSKTGSAWYEGDGKCSVSFLNDSERYYNSFEMLSERALNVPDLGEGLEFNDYGELTAVLDDAVIPPTEHYYGSFRLRDVCTLNDDGSQTMKSLVSTKRKPMLVIVTENLPATFDPSKPDYLYRRVWACGTTETSTGATDWGWIHVSKYSNSSSWSVTFSIGTVEAYLIDTYVSTKADVYNKFKDRYFNYIVLCE